MWILGGSSRLGSVLAAFHNHLLGTGLVPPIRWWHNSCLCKVRCAGVSRQVGQGACSERMGDGCKCAWMTALASCGVSLPLVSSDGTRSTAALLVLSREGACGTCCGRCRALSTRRTWWAVNTPCLPSHGLEPSCFAPRADRAATTRHTAWLTLHRHCAARGARVPLQAAHAVVGTRQIGGHPVCATIAEQRRARSWPAV